MEKLGIYEYVAVIVPGVVFLFGVSVIAPEGTFEAAVVVPSDLGTATVHLVLAFALGHLLQVVGQLVHGFYWSDFGGLPTDWPFTRQHREFVGDLKELVAETAGMASPRSLMEWRQAVATARSLVTADGRTQRLETFQANYGMFRSLAVAAMLLLILNAWWSSGASSTSGVIAAVLLVSVLGMHRFAVHYAREIFSAVRARHRELQMEASADHPTVRLELPRIRRAAA